MKAASKPTLPVFPLEGFEAWMKAVSSDGCEALLPAIIQEAGLA